MLILGIILTILGFIIFQWSANALSKSFIERPLIFANLTAVIIIHILWIGLLIGGLILLWQANPVIVGVILGGYFILWVIGYFLGSENASIKRIFKTYKQLELFHPQATEEEILKETARLYFQRLRWDEYRINHILKIIFEEKTSTEVKNIKDLIKSILIFERPRDDLWGNYNFKSFMKSMEQYEKRDKFIDEIYKKELEKTIKITERPVLSEQILKRMEQIGLNPNEMSNEQLATFESLENPEKSHWVAKIFTYVSYGLLILAVISLLTSNWKYLFIYLIAALILGYIGYTIQTRIAGKQFMEASIKKFARSKILEKKEFLYCPNCGAEIKKNTSFCSQCGEKIKI